MKFSTRKQTIERRHPTVFLSNNPPTAIKHVFFAPWFVKILKRIVRGKPYHVNGVPWKITLGSKENKLRFVFASVKGKIENIKDGNCDLQLFEPTFLIPE